MNLTIRNLSALAAIAFTSMAANALTLTNSEPAVGVVESIPGTIKLYFDQTPDYNWGADPGKSFKVTDAAGNVAATGSFFSVATWESPANAPIYLSGAIEAPGTYTLTIPKGTFVQDGNSGNQCDELKLTWTIKSDNGEGENHSTYDFKLSTSYPLSEGATYDYAYEGYSPFDGVLLTWASTAEFNSAIKPYIEDANGNKTYSIGAMGFMGTGVRVNFDIDQTKLWKSGTYKLVIPEGFVGTPEWKAANYLEGSCNAEKVITFKYIEDPALAASTLDFPLEVSIFGWYGANGEAVVNYLDKPQTSPTIPGGSVLKIGSNKNEYCMDVYVEVTDLAKDEVMWVAGTYRQAVTSETDIRTINGKNEEGVFELPLAEIYDLEFVNGHEYSINVGFYKQFDGVAEANRICYDTLEYKFGGTTAAYEYSPYTISDLSIPETSEFINTDLSSRNLTISFDGPVEIDQERSGVIYSSGIVPFLSVNRASVDNTKWTLTISPSVISNTCGTVDLRLYVKDTDDRPVRSNVYYTSGSKENTYITLTYYSYLGGNEITVATPEIGSEVESLYDFVFTTTATSGNGRNIGFQGMDAYGKLLNITITDANGEVVGTLDRSDIQATEDGELNIDCQMHLTEAITTPGTYTLNVPGACFMTNTESASKANKPAMFNFIVKNNGSIGDDDDNNNDKNQITTAEISWADLGISGRVGGKTYTAEPLTISFISSSSNGAKTYSSSTNGLCMQISSNSSIGISCQEGYKLTKIVYSERDYFEFPELTVNTGELAIDGQKATWTPTLTRAEDNVVNVIVTVPSTTYFANPIVTYEKVEGTTGVAAVDVECGDAVYYNLQGVRVENPEKGIFVKVVNGKASKVVK